LHRIPAAIALAVCVCLIAAAPAGADVGVVPPDLRNPAFREIHGSPRMDERADPPIRYETSDGGGFDWGTASAVGAGFAVAIGAGWLVAAAVGRRRRGHVLR
jgi:hypothetical protein